MCLTAFEYALVGDIERELRESGYKRLRGIFVPTAKNMPAAGLYDRLGYRELEQEEWDRDKPAERGADGAEAVSAGPQTGGWQAALGEPGARVYEICLDQVPGRTYYVKIEKEKEE